VYQYLNVDTLGNEVITGTDTVRIVGDSVINGKTYACFKGGLYFNCPGCSFFRRDSSGYIIDQNGDIFFSETNYTDTLRVHDYLPASITYFKMTHHDSVITIPSGTFTISDFEAITYHDSTYPWVDPRSSHNMYASGIGLIKVIDYYTLSSDNIEIRLIAYHIGP
jgi:hypothetical protein